MGLGRLVGGRYRPIAPYAGSWAATVHAATTPTPPVPAILANEERLRQFKLRRPAYVLLGPAERGRLWAEFAAGYRDGVVRLPYEKE